MVRGCRGPYISARAGNRRTATRSLPQSEEVAGPRSAPPSFQKVASDEPLWHLPGIDVNGGPDARSVGRGCSPRRVGNRRGTRRRAEASTHSRANPYEHEPLEKPTIAEAWLQTPKSSTGSSTLKRSGVELPA